MPRKPLLRALAAGVVAGGSIALTAAADLAHDVWKNPGWHSHLLYMLLAVGILLGITTSVLVEGLQSRHDLLRDEVADLKREMEATRERAVEKWAIGRLEDAVRHAVQAWLHSRPLPTGLRWRLGIEDASTGTWLTTPFGDPGIGTLLGEWTPRPGHMLEPEELERATPDLAYEYAGILHCNLSFQLKLHVRIVIPDSTSPAEARLATKGLYDAVDGDDLHREVDEYLMLRLATRGLDAVAS